MQSCHKSVISYQHSVIGHQMTSGARETIFMNFFSRNSRATGPKSRRAVNAFVDGTADPVNIGIRRQRRLVFEVHHDGIDDVGFSDRSRVSCARKSS